MSPALDTVDTEQDPMMVSPPWFTAKPATSPTSKLKKLRLKVELDTNLREVWSFTTQEKAQVGAFTACDCEIFAKVRLHLWLQGKDYKKGGDGLRGKNVTEAYRVKDKDLKRTMK